MTGTEMEPEWDSEDSIRYHDGYEQGIRDAAASWAGLRDAVKAERDTWDMRAAGLVVDGKPEQAERCYGAVTALDWMLARIDRMDPAKETGQ